MVLVCVCHEQILRLYLDERCKKKFCLQDWYSAAKTIAEETALEYGEKNGLTVVTVCPCLVLGPLLQPLVNTSSELLIYIIKGGLYIFLLVSIID